MVDSNLTSSPVEPNLKLKKHENEDKVDVTLFKQIVGSLRCVWKSRLDIGFSVGLVRRIMDESKVSHMKTVRRILRYLKWSINRGILFPRDSESKEDVINLYSNVDLCRDNEDWRSTHGYFFQVFGAPISWFSRKQHVVTLSSCDVEYIAESYVSCQVIRIIFMLEEVKVKVKKPLVLQIANKSAINLARIWFLMEGVSIFKLDFISRGRR